MKNKKIFFIVLFNSISYNFFINSSSPEIGSFNYDHQKKHNDSFASSTPLNIQEDKSNSSSPAAQTPFNKQKKDRPSSTPSYQLENKDIKVIEYILKNEKRIIDYIYNIKKTFKDENELKEYIAKHNSFLTTLRAYCSSILQKFKNLESRINIKNDSFKLIPRYNHISTALDHIKSSLTQKKIDTKREESYENIKKIDDCSNIKQNFNLLQPEDYEFLKSYLDKNMIEKMKNKSLLTKKAEDYIYYGYNLYATLSCKKILNEFEEINNITKNYTIEKWNLLHVFLGNLKNDKFSGLHFFYDEKYIKSAYSKIIRIKDKMNPLPDEVLDTIVFYKKNELFDASNSKPDTNQLTDQGYFIKRCTVFNKNLISIEKIIDIVKSALNSKNIYEEKLNNLITFKTKATLKNNSIIDIIFFYSPLEKSIDSFFPTFDSFDIYEANISTDDYEKINEDKSYSQFMNETSQSFKEIKDILEKTYNAKKEERDKNLAPFTKESNDDDSLKTDIKDSNLEDLNLPLNINILTKDEFKQLDELIEKNSFDSFNEKLSKEKEEKAANSTATTPSKSISPTTTPSKSTSILGDSNSMVLKEKPLLSVHQQAL